MASRKSVFHAKTNSIFPTSSIGDNQDGLFFEFDEADIWGSTTAVADSNSNSNSKKSSIPSFREPKKMGRKMMADQTARVASASLPVNIPDWSKILKEGYNEQRKSDIDEDGDDDFDDHHDGDDGGDGRVPPHEYLARTRGASFSVHEGIGRTLKGRDLRRVRNAIWKKVGFED